MKTVYSRLLTLIVLLVAGTMLFAPMRFGNEDYLYANPPSLRMNPGESYALSYQLYSELPQAVRYSSSDEGVASVDRSGVVTAVKPGKAYVMMNAEGGAKARVRIDVAGLPVSTLTLNTDALYMEKGQVSGLRAIFNDQADNAMVNWRSEDERVATVDAVGRVCAVGGGETRVVVTSMDGLTASASVSVHVRGNAVHISPEEATVGVGAYLHLGARYLPSDTTDVVTSWMSSNEDILRIQQDGTLYAAAEGQAVLSVFSRDGLSGSTLIKVERPAAEFEVSPAAVTMERGSSLTLEPRFFDAQGNLDAASSEHYVTWTSSNPAVATVDENGFVLAVSSGTARINAAADGKITSCSVIVQTFVDEIRLNMNELYALREQTIIPIQLEAEVFPADADDTRLTWSADNDLVATVNQRGLVRLVGGYGTATVTVRASSGAEAKFVVNVVAELPEGAGTETGLLQ